MKKKYTLSICLLFFWVSSFSQSFLDGIFVLNEGNMGSNAASVSFITQDNQVVNNVFGTANNNAVLGDVGQSMSFYGDIAFIVLNYSSVIKVVNNETFASIASIESGLVNPRYTAFYQNKAYVTCWGDGTITTDDYLAVINLNTYQVESTIPMSEGVELIKEINGKLYVTHQGGYGYGTTLSVVDPITLNITAVTVGDVPNSMVVKDNYLYVLCGGMPNWSPAETSGKLVKVDLTTNTVVSELDFGTNLHPNHLNLEGDNLYYTLGSDIYKMEANDAVLPSTVFVPSPVTDFLGIYGLDVIDGKIYVADANGYAANGQAHVYTTDGLFQSSYTVGNIPNHFYKSKVSNLAVTESNPIAAISLYPNPATSVFYLNTNEMAEIKIYDFTGKIVKDEFYNQSGIDVSNLSKGVYIVEVAFENAKQTTKLVIR